MRDNVQSLHQSSHETVTSCNLRPRCCQTSIYGVYPIAEQQAQLETDCAVTDKGIQGRSESMDDAMPLKLHVGSELGTVMICQLVSTSLVGISLGKVPTLRFPKGTVAAVLWRSIKNLLDLASCPKVEALLCKMVEKYSRRQRLTGWPAAPH
jgi:hypothetical protein